MSSKTFVFRIAGADSIGQIELDSCVRASFTGSVNSADFFADSASALIDFGDANIQVFLRDGLTVNLVAKACGVVFEDGICSVDCDDFDTLG